MKSSDSAPQTALGGFEFGDFRLDPLQRRLWRRDGAPIELSPRLFDALLYFVERPGQLLDKEALLQALWPGLVVEENNLSQLVSGLRRALGDESLSSRYIQTVPRRGFRFVARVSHSDTASADSNYAATTMPADDSGSDSSSDGTFGRTHRRRWLMVLLSGAAASAVGWLWRRQSTSEVTQPATLAVLPFKPLVTEGREELLEVGMADSLIARLSTVPGLVVRSVGSVRRYAGPDQDPLRAARELDAAWIVDGSLQRWGDQVRVTARLVRAADGVALWSGQFDEKFTGMFDVQDAISERVARVLAPRLGSGELGRLTGAGGTRNADAYQLYLAARLNAQAVRAAGLRKSVELYNKAIDIDPRFALAHAGLVETYRRMIFGADAEPMAAFEPAKIAAQRALQLDPGLAEAHAGLGWIRFWYEWDWPGAEAVFRRAIELNPNVVEARFGLGLLLLSLDRSDEGFAQLKSARELDPASLILNTLEGGFLLARGKRDEGLARVNRVLDIEPNFWIAHLTLAGFHLADSQPDKAIESLQKADRLADQSTQATGLLGFVLARHGRRDEAQAVLQRLLSLQQQRYVPPTSIAMVYSGLGAVPQALDALERAYSMRDTRLVYMKDDGRWASLRQEPRFVALLRRMKLDTYAAGTPAN